MRAYSYMSGARKDAKADAKRLAAEAAGIPVRTSDDPRQPIELDLSRVGGDRLLLEPRRGHLQHALVSAIRTRHYSRRTEQAYWHWTRAFVLWSGRRHPLEMGAPEVGAFLSHLATEREVSASTQRQALAAVSELANLRKIAN